MTNALDQLATYLMLNEHWLRLALMLIGVGVLAIGLSLWWQATRKPWVAQAEPERRYRREVEVALAELGSLPLDESGE